MLMNLEAVDWAQVGEAVGVALLAAGSAMAGARRVWRKGLGELLRPSVEREVSRAVRSSMRSLQAGIREALREEVRTVVHEELAPLRDDMDDVKEYQFAVPREGRGMSWSARWASRCQSTLEGSVTVPGFSMAARAARSR